METVSDTGAGSSLEEFQALDNSPEWGNFIKSGSSWNYSDIIDFSAFPFSDGLLLVTTTSKR